MPLEPIPSGLPIPLSNEIIPNAGTPTLAENMGAYEVKIFGKMPQVDLSVLHEDLSHLDVSVTHRASEWAEKQVVNLKRVQDGRVATLDGEVSVRARYEVEYIHGEPSRLRTRALQNWLKDPANRYEPTDDVVRAAKESAIRTIKGLPRDHVQRMGKNELLRRYEASYYSMCNTRHPDESVQRDTSFTDSAKRYGESSADTARRHNAFQRLQKREDVVRRYEVNYINGALSEKYQKTVETPQFVRYEATPIIKRAARQSAERFVASLKTQDSSLFKRLSGEIGGEEVLIKSYEAQYLRDDSFYDDANVIYNPSRGRYEPNYEPSIKYEAK